MGKLIDFGWRPIHDPEFGIRHENIAPQINRKNWRVKACCRMEGNRTLYVLIQRGVVRRGEDKGARYYVKVHSGDPHGQRWNADFKMLRDAIDYANGRDGSDFAISTRPAGPSEYPHEVGPVTYITGMRTGADGRATPTLSIQLRTK